MAIQLLQLYAKIHNHTYENSQAELSTKQVSCCKIFTSYTISADSLGGNKCPSTSSFISTKTGSFHGTSIYL